MKPISERILKDALLPLEKDERDFQLGDLITLPALSDLPASYTAGLPPVNNQDTPLNPYTDVCAADASCTILWLREMVELGFEWAFAVAKMITGNIESSGTDLRTICTVYTKYGVIERSQSPFSIETQQLEFMRNISNWPQNLFQLALKHQQGSYLAVSGPYDPYDNCRATMWQFRNEKCGILFGVLWGWPLTQTIIDTVPTSGSGHALAQIGWDEQGIFVQNSAGVEAGTAGRHYFTREVINAFVGTYGAFVIHPLPPATIKRYTAAGIQLDDSWIMKILKMIQYWITKPLGS